MSDSRELYTGVRPSDVRFDNVHVLAEYIEAAQRFVDATAQGQGRIVTDTQTLLTKTDRIASELHKIHNGSRALLAGAVHLSETLNTNTHAIKNGLHSELDHALERIENANKNAHEKSASMLEKMTNSLIQNIETKLHLDAYKKEVENYCTDCQSAVKSYIKSERNKSFLHRLAALFSNPEPTIALPSAPTLHEKK